jgi:tRNA(Ile)-lysidine synthase
MIQKGDRVLVAFSGGPDSCALLLLLDELKKKYGISLCAGHVNHMLRGKESSEDEKWVKKTCEDLKIPCKTVKKNINKLKKKGESLEEAARKIRYEALEKIAKDFKANKIAFGHNRNDQIETILFRIIRGAGEDGLSGIPASRDLPAPMQHRDKQAGLTASVKIIRPLLETERGEIDEYLKAKNIKPRIDSSNLDTKFFRNKIRHELIPYLEKFNPKIQEGLLKIAQISRENSEYIRQTVQKILKDISMRMPDAVKIDIDKLTAYPQMLRNNILREFAKDFKGLDYANLKEIEKIIDSKRANLVLRLSSGIEIAKEHTHLFIRRIKMSKEFPYNKNYSYALEKEGKIFIPEAGKNISVSIDKKDKKTALDFKDANQIYFDADKIKFPFTIRNRKSGDRFSPFGMKKEKKLKDFFIDEKIPAKERDRVPILVAKDGKILWIMGYRRNNLGIITKNTRKIIKVELS